ncbi:MAG: hypothetical protein ACRDQ5_13490 [Sciscionella sp.]
MLRRHLAYNASLARLTSAGVSVLDPDAVITRAEDGLASFAWPHILAVLNERTSSEVGP